MLPVASPPLPNALISVINFDISMVAFEAAIQFESKIISDSSFIQLDRRNTLRRRRIFFIKKSVKKYYSSVFFFYQIQEKNEEIFFFKVFLKKLWSQQINIPNRLIEDSKVGVSLFDEIITCIFQYHWSIIPSIIQYCIWDFYPDIDSLVISE